MHALPYYASSGSLAWDQGYETYETALFRWSRVAFDDSCGCCAESMRLHMFLVLVWFQAVQLQFSPVELRIRVPGLIYILYSTKSERTTRSLFTFRFLQYYLNRNTLFVFLLL